MDNRKEEATLIEKWAIWIVAFCFMFMLLGIGLFVYNKTVRTPQPIKLKIEIAHDTIAGSPTYTKSEVDSLIILTKSTLDSYKTHFETVEIKKEQDDIYKTFGSLVLGIIVALCGFFGFKSFKDIKDKGEQMAKELSEKKAKEIADIVAKEAAENYLKSQLPGIVKKELDDSFKGTMVQSFKDSVIADMKPEVMRLLQEQKEDGNEDQGEEDETLDGVVQMGIGGIPQAQTPEQMFNPS